MRYLLVILLLSCSFCFAQKDSSVVYTIVEKAPEPVGGIPAFYGYIQKNIKNPAGINGKCYLRFIVEKDGRITNTVVTQGISGCPDCDKEAIRLVNTNPCKWKPGHQNGKAERVYYNIPIKFEKNLE